MEKGKPRTVRMATSASSSPTSEADGGGGPLPNWQESAPLVMKIVLGRERSHGSASLLSSHPARAGAALAADACTAVALSTDCILNVIYFGSNGFCKTPLGFSFVRVHTLWDRWVGGYVGWLWKGR